MTSPGKRVAVAQDRRALAQYLQVQRVADKAILDALAVGLKSAEKHLAQLAGRSGIGAAIRRDQLRGNIAAIKNEVIATHRRILMVLFSSRGDAASAAVKAMAIYETSFFRMAGAGAEFDSFLSGLDAGVRAGVDTLRTRLSTSRIELSRNVYRSAALANGKVDSIVNSALVRGASAKELAADIRAFILPDASGGITYAAMRLGRTELNNAFHAQTAALCDDAPWIQAAKWNLSSSHPKPDNCDAYAGSSHFSGGKAGEYKTDEVPQKPHPHCFCFITPVMVEEEDFIRNLNAGAYRAYMNQYLD